MPQTPQKLTTVCSQGPKMPQQPFQAAALLLQQVAHLLGMLSRAQQGGQVVIPPSVGKYAQPPHAC